MKPSNDREAIALILYGLEQRGCKVTEVAQDTWEPDDLTPVTSVSEAVDLVMEVDEATVYVDRPDGGGSFIYFVLGNEPEEVACDYGVSLSEFIDPITDPWWK